MFSIITIHEQGDASLNKSGIKTEQAAKMLRGKLAKKYDFESFVIVSDDTANAKIAGLNGGSLTFTNGEIVPVVKATTPKKTGGKKTVIKGQVPANILHMIAVTTGNAHQQWVNIATRNYGYQGV